MRVPLRCPITEVRRCGACAERKRVFDHADHRYEVMGAIEQKLVCPIHHVVLEVSRG